MSLPLTTTTVKVDKPTVTDDDPLVADVWQTVAARVRAHISSPGATDVDAGGQRTEAVLFVPFGTPIDRTCRVYDWQTAQWWAVTSMVRRSGLGLDHLKCGLRAWDGGQ